MTTSLDHLLPGPEESVRCADHARRIHVDPGGTAIRAERVVLVATPLPWPKPALSHPDLKPLTVILDQGSVPTRVLAYVPSGPDLSPDPGSAVEAPAVEGPVVEGPAVEGPVVEWPAAEGPAVEGPVVEGLVVEGGRGVEMVVFERQGPSAVERWYHTTTGAQSLELARAVAAGDLDQARPFLTAQFEPARPTVLVCTQGSHDVCCGAEGTRLASELQARADATLAAHGGRDPYRLFRVSHTGGHRFAPTAMTLPDGRMWAGLSPTLVEQILDRSAEVAQVAPICRGWWGADTGPAQVAERAVFAQRGWSLDDHDRLVEIETPPGTAAVSTGAVSTGAVSTGAVSTGPVLLATVSIVETGEQWQIELAPGRTVPTIACREPGGQPAKPAQEYDVVAVRPPAGEGLSRTG